MALLIGSRALKFWHPRFPRENDYDLVMGRDEMEVWAETIGAPIQNKLQKSIIEYDGQKFEIEFDDVPSNSILVSRPHDREIDIWGLTCQVATPEELLAIKRSHRHFPDHWHKNVKDYLFLRSFYELDSDLEELSKIRRQEKEKRTGRSKRTLHMGNEDFFEGSQSLIRRKYVHDDLHYATCYYDAPLWTRCKKDDGQAFVERSLFDQLSPDDQVRMVQEEAFAIALERKIIPDPSIDTMRAYRYAVMRIGTTLTKGWFREFTIENYHKVMKFDHDFVGMFHDALDKNKIRLFDKE